MDCGREGAVAVREDNRGGTERRRRAALTSPALAVCLAVASAVAQGTVPPPTPGVIARLTVETREQAVECGRAGADCAVRPYELCPGDGRYVATLVTPFSRVASAVLDAERNGRSLSRLGAASVNRWGVAIYVSPIQHSTDPESIARLEIRRGGRVILPTKTTVGVVTVTLSDGSTRPSTRGFFAVPADVFEPSTDVDIAFIGSSTQATCRLDRDRLRALR
jgi:hypothetical protein